MSDEHDTADGGDGTGGGQTAVATPLRPTGKRTRQRALTADDAELTESGAVELGSDTNGADKHGSHKNGKGTKAKKTKKSSGPSRNPFAFVWNYLKQVVAELRKVIWPNRKQMVTYTSVVLVFLAFMVALISGVDLGLAKLVLLVFG